MNQYFRFFKKYLESDPENLEYQAKANIAYTHLGIVYFLADEYEKSKEAFEKALPISAKLLEKDPENPIYIGRCSRRHSKNMQSYSKNWTGMKKQKNTSAKAERLKKKLEEQAPEKES